MPGKEAIPLELDAHKQVNEVVVRYERAVDRCDREMILSTRHPDGWDDQGVFIGTVQEFADWFVPLHLSMVWASHCNTNVRIELVGAPARSEIYVIANLRCEEDARLYDLFGSGRYLDRFERRDSQRLIAHGQAISDWNRVDKVNRQAAGPVTNFLEKVLETNGIPPTSISKGSALNDANYDRLRNASASRLAGPV